LTLDSVDLPRDAFFAAAAAVPVAEAIGRVAAEQITPYPPGIPAVVPGERLTAEVLDYLRAAWRPGWSCPTLQTRPWPPSESPPGDPGAPDDPHLVQVVWPPR
jgi:hypothetical protein